MTGPTPGICMSGESVRAGRASAVVRDGEAVGLVADLLEEVQRGRVLRKDDRLRDRAA